MNGATSQATLTLALNERRSVLSASAGVEMLLGYKADEFLNGAVTLQDRIHPADADIVARLFSAETSQTSGTFNIRLRHGDGRIRCVRGEYSKHLNGHGTGILELCLMDAKCIYRSGKEPAGLTTVEPMMDLIGEAQYFKNRDHVFTAANQTAMKSLSEAGDDGVDLRGLTDYDLFPEEYADISYALEQRVLSGTPAACQIQHLPSCGQPKKWLNSVKYAVKDADGSVIGLFGVTHDISGHKEILDRLRESEELLKETERIAGLCSYLLDIRTGVWRGSDNLESILGVDAAHPRTIAGWMALVYVEDRDRTSSALARQLAQRGTSFTDEYRIIRPSDGERRWLRNSGRIEYDADGNPTFFRGTIQDITDSKQVGTALPDSQGLVQLFVEHAPAAIAMLDPDMRYLAVSRRWLDVHSLNGQQLVGRSHCEVFPELPQSFREDYRRALLGETVRTGEDILKREDGSVHYICRELRPWISGDGVIGGIVIFSEDITDQKQIEAALRKSKELLQVFIEHAPVAIAMFDLQMRYLAVSRLWAQDHSIEEREIIGRSHYEVNPEVPERWKETHRRGLAGEIQQVEEDRYDRANGAVEWIRWQITPWRAGDGSIGGIVMFYEDITSRKLSEFAQRESKELLQVFIDRAPAPLAMFDREMRYLAVSRRWLEENFLDGRDVLGRSHYEIVPDVPERWKEAHRRGLAGESLRADEDRFERVDGTVQWIRSEVIPWRTGNGSVGGIILFAEDITKHRQIDERLRLAASVFTNAREGIMITDATGAILEVNDMFTRITGYTREEVLGKNPRILKSGVQSDEFYTSMWCTLLQEGHWSGEVWNRSKAGEIYAETLTIDAVRDGTGKVLQYVALFSDITQLKKQEQVLEHLTHFDVLTGLPNRSLLMDRLHQAMAQANRRKQSVAVAYLDLDGFKKINQQQGREAGDRLLSSLAFDLKRALREGDTLARLGGDEFVAVILDLDTPEASIPLLEQLLGAAAQPIQVGDLSVCVSATIGVAFYPQEGEVDPDLLLRQADQAMYQAKLAGGNRYHIYDPDHDLSVRGRHENVEHIRQGLAADQFVLYYQPKVNMRTGKVVGVEGLIRWRHPERGLLLPSMFLPVIEDHALAIDIGEWVIETALGQMESWHDAGLEMPVSVNVGALQLQQPGFVDRLSAHLAAHPRVRPFSLELEVLETSALRDVAQTSQVLNACNAIGVQFVLDDFGTGYSSLTYLKRLPASALKIDQSFVSDMLEDPENLNILEGIFSLASAFHRQVIAEGVETVEHGLMLLQLGCELAQGYGIARPMPAADLAAWVSDWRPDPRWASVPHVHPGNRALLYACVEHRAWVAAFESYLMGKRHAPPALDQRLCRFGKWLEAEKLAGRGNEPATQTVTLSHQKFHDLAGTIFAAQSRGRSSDGVARLGELHGMCEQFLQQVERLRYVS